MTQIKYKGVDEDGTYYEFFRESGMALKEYLHAVRENWQGYEEMRIDATRAHGWGDGSPTSTALAARMNRDLMGIADGLVGTYGGTIAIGHLAYTEVRWWGEKTRSTPDFIRCFRVHLWKPLTDKH